MKYARSQITNHAPTRRSQVIGAGGLTFFGFGRSSSTDEAVIFPFKAENFASSHPRMLCLCWNGTT